MIDVEQRGLEIGLDAVRAQQLLDRADECVLAPCGGLVAGELLEIAERRDELRQGNRLDGAPLERDERGRSRPCAASTCASASSA